ncbi:hypothetical protein TI03_06805 [Achromatium sp. WMS1]|nr:hypothetical protein TI03_06805 [Achromatium sp. WMS1]
MASTVVNSPLKVEEPQNYQMPRIGDLCALLDTYTPKKHIKKVYRAYLFSAEAHKSQYRQS